MTVGIPGGGWIEVGDAKAARIVAARAEPHVTERLVWPWPRVWSCPGFVLPLTQNPATQQLYAKISYALVV